MAFVYKSERNLDNSKKEYSNLGPGYYDLNQINSKKQRFLS